MLSNVLSADLNVYNLKDVSSREKAILENSTMINIIVNVSVYYF